MRKTCLLIALVALGCQQHKATENVVVSKENTKEVSKTEEVKHEPATQPEYRASRTILTDLIATKLEVSFDWNKSWMMGKETLNAKPHFYPTDSLVLDAKGMEIKGVSMNGSARPYTYTNDKLVIRLDKTYARTENYTVVIDYIAKPDERVTAGSAAITSDKGLYFINPKGTEKNKMPQIWTQGETEANSVWFPTIDSPNSKTKQEIFITVADKYRTLSNGKLITSKKNADGTRTDHWRQELPHSTYLFMMGIGEFKVVSDTYKRWDGSTMEVNYYVEPEWEPYARNIFGETPAMIGFFSKLLGVEYVWDKYSQIIVREYVSGAMENTGCVVFGDYAYKTDRELLDGNDNSTIAHELFHHWFGDLATAESWSNLSLNESFANYSQYLWDEHRYGLDEADYQAEQEADGYFQSGQQGGFHDLIWFQYQSQEDMFDGHSYNKGGRILHMLRNYLGDEAFFLGLQNYLKANSFKAAEFNQLRLAFEEVSGQDLNWFFNQWYLASGHPKLDITHKTDDATKTAIITVKQKQDLTKWPLFILPVDVIVYDDKGETKHRIMINNENNEFRIPYTGTLKNVLFDSQAMLLSESTEQKDPAFYIHQYYNGKRYAARKAGLVNGLKLKTPEAEKMILDAMKDPFWDIRLTAMEKFSRLKDQNKTAGIEQVKKMALSDSISSVRSAAINILVANLPAAELKPFLEERISTDPSYLVVSTALNQLGKADPARAMVLAKGMENDKSSKVLSGIARLYGTNGTAEQYAFYDRVFSNNLLQGFDGLGALNSFTVYLSKQDLATQRKALGIYKSQAENGGMYTKMFIPQHMTYLSENLAQQVTAYKAEEEKAKKEGNTNSAEMAKAKQSEAEALMKDFQAISASLGGDKGE